MTTPQARWLGKVLDGWLNYFAVPMSHRYLSRFASRLKRMWIAITRRRSQRDRFGWAQVDKLTTKYWPKVEIRHPWPNRRLAVSVYGNSATRGRSRMP